MGSQDGWYMPNWVWVPCMPGWADIGQQFGRGTSGHGQEQEQTLSKQPGLMSGLFGQCELGPQNGIRRNCVRKLAVGDETWAYNGAG